MHSPPSTAKNKDGHFVFLVHTSLRSDSKSRRGNKKSWLKEGMLPKKRVSVTDGIRRGKN
jgi:hypothetical protein